MISKLKIESFKSIQSAELDLGQVNMFIGANGSGKSNLLEAIAVLSAAAAGTVDQSTLVWRGCRASDHFRPMFEGCRLDADTTLSAGGELADYIVTLRSPIGNRGASWGFMAEYWKEGETELLNRQPETNGFQTDPERGLAALRLAETPPSQPASVFLKALGTYSIYAAATPILQGWTRDPQERAPVGLGGGLLAGALNDLLDIPEAQQAIDAEFHACVDWFEEFGVRVNPESGAQANGLVFRDRYFRKELRHRYLLNSGDVNEGALYLAFLAVLGLHPQAPRLFAVENVDHGLNPLLAKRLMSALSARILKSDSDRQVFLTTHNPLVLDGLPLGDDRVRLFTLDRDNKGHSVVRRFIVTDKHREMATKGWTLSRMWINKLIGGVPDV